MGIPEELLRPKTTSLLDDAGEPVSQTNPLPVGLVTQREVIWRTPANWSTGTFTTTEVSGSGDSAVVQLSDLTDNADDIPFDTSTSYTMSDAGKIEISSGRLRLKVQSGSDMNWPFDTTTAYTYDSNKIEVTGGVAKLKGITSVYAQWHLNEDSGTSVADAGPNDYTGTTQNMEDADWVAGKLNNCLQFDGANEYVDCGNIADFTHTSAFSVEAWVKTGTISRMIMARHNGTRGWFLYITNTGQVMWRLSNNYGSNDLSVKSVGSITDNAWHHVVGTHDGNNTTTGFHIYLDGSNDDGDTVSHLTATIQVGVNMRLAAWNSGLYLNGNLDEVLVYDKELSSAEVTTRWNSGSGTELEQIPTDDPTIYPNTGFSFTAFLSSFVESSTTPTTTAIRHIVSDDNGVTYYWHDGTGWTVSAGTYAEANSASTINTNLGTFTDTGTFIPKSFLHSTDGSTNLELDNIYIAEPTTYSKDDNLYGDTKDVSQIAPTNLSSWLTINFESTTPSNAHIGVLFSNDGRTNWLTYAAGWSATGSPTLRASSVSLSDAVANFASLPLGSNTLDMRVFLKVDTITASTPEMLNASITSDAGQAVSGHWESDKYDSSYLDVAWEETTFDITVPTGTSITVRAQTHNTTTSFTSTAYGATLTSGENLSITGQYIQFKAEFSGTVAVTPSMNELTAKFSTLQYTVASP